VIDNATGEAVMHEDELPSGLKELAESGELMDSSLSVSASSSAYCYMSTSSYTGWLGGGRFSASASGTISTIGGVYEAMGEGTFAGAETDTAAWPVGHSASVWEAAGGNAVTGQVISYTSEAYADSLLAPGPLHAAHKRTAGCIPYPDVTE
jgi:hypothetical protein